VTDGTKGPADERAQADGPDTGVKPDGIEIVPKSGEGTGRRIPIGSVSAEGSVVRELDFSGFEALGE